MWGAAATNPTNTPLDVVTTVEGRVIERGHEWVVGAELGDKGSEHLVERG